MTRLRLLRLSRGWEPVQLIGKMKILADRDEVPLPAVYLLVRLVFLWENHRATMPGYYAGLLSRVYGEPIRVPMPTPAGPSTRDTPTGPAIQRHGLVAAAPVTRSTRTPGRTITRTTASRHAVDVEHDPRSRPGMRASGCHL
jgi:hypothetical protein